MRPGLAAFLMFFAGTIAVYCIIAFGYVAWADMTEYSDREGATVMGIFFGFAPMGGLVGGIASAIAAYRAVSRRRQAAVPKPES